MKRLLLLTVFTPFFIFSQKNISRVVSRDVIDAGYKLYDEEKYEEAIIEYQKININDTAYAIAQYEIALTETQLEHYTEAEEILKNLLEYKIHFNFKDKVYMALGNCYDLAKNPEEAIKVYSDGLKLFPYQHNLLYNRGVAYAGQNKFKEAIADYQYAIQCNPYHANSHLALGLLAANEGLYAQAMLSLLTFAWINPYDTRTPSITGIIERMSKGSLEKEPKNIKELFGPDNYEDYNLLFENKIALQNTYKVKMSVPTSYGKQLHLFLKENQYNKENMDFWNQHYLPFFERIWKGKMFDQFTMVPLVSFDSDEIQSKLKSKIPKIKTFYTLSKDLFTEAISNQYMEFESKKQWINVEYQPSHLVAMGVMNDKNQSTGNFYIYHKNGLLKMIAHYDNAGKPIGTWEIYDEFTGLISRKVGFTNKDTEKFQYSYYDTGELSLFYKMVNEETEDTITYYYKNGTIKEQYLVTKGIKNGPYKAYYADGSISVQMDYKNGLAEGPYISHSTNGIVDDEFTLTNNQINGKRKKYYPNGQLMSEYNYVNGKYDGEYVTYFFDGKIEEKGSYKNGIQVGKYEEYFSSGALATSMQLDESGKQNGVSTQFDLDGKKYEELEFSKGELKSITYTDKAGKSTVVAAKKGKKIDYIRTRPNGKQSIVGQYNDDSKVGEWKYFDDFGNLIKKEIYKDGEMTDTLKAFYANGKLKSISVIKNGYRDGLYQFFNEFGDLMNEGYYTEGEYDNEWIGYFSDGSISYKNFYVQGNQQGYQIAYNVANKLDAMDEYDNGKLIAHNQFDTLENLLSQNAEYNGEIKLKDPSNTYVNFIGNYKNGTADGEFKWYTVNNVLTGQGNYKNGEKVGVWKWYSNKGVLTREITYVNGEISGKDINYDDNGKLESEFNYINGDRQGKFTFFNPNGKVSVEGQYLDDERHGEVRYYDLKGNVTAIRYYRLGVFLSYSYLGPDGNPVKPIELDGNVINVLCYYKNGKKSNEHKRVNGLIEGKYITYYDNGKVWENEDYENGQINGKSLEYNEQGVKIVDATYLKGQLHGKYLKYNDQGKLIYEANYRFGDLHGEVKTYSPDGKLVSITTYYGDDATGIKTF